MHQALPWRHVFVALFALLVCATFLLARAAGPLPGPAVVGLFLAFGGAWAWAGARLDRPSLQALFDRDLFEGPTRWALIGLWYAIRAPLLFIGGYSGDLDSWRVAVVARRVIDQGSYQPSRWPGYPLVEIGLAPIIKLGGPIAANLVTATIGLVGLYLFDRLGRRLGLRSMGLATLVAAVAAPVVLNTASTVDYPWALTPLLGAALAATHRRWALAGLLLGVATGCRLPMSTYGLPLLLLALRDPEAPRAVRDLCLAAAVTVVFVLSPLWIQYGAGFLRAYGQSADAASASLRVIWGLGMLTLLGSAPVLVDIAQGRGLSPDETPAGRLRTDGMLVLLFWMVIAWFVALPVQGAYLFPLVPFGLLVAARWARPAAMVALGLCMTVANAWDIRPGFIPEELDGRAEDLAPARALERQDLPAGSMVVVGVSYPVVRGLNPDWTVEPAEVWRDEVLHDEARDLYVALDPKLRDLKAHLKGGGQVFFLGDDVLADWQKKNDADPLELGAEVLSDEARGEGRAARREDDGPAEEKPTKGKGKREKKPRTDEAPAAGGPLRWVSSAPAATTLKETEGRVVIEVNRKDEAPIEVCQEPAQAADAPTRVRTRWKVKQLEPSGEISFNAVWLKGGEEVGREVIGSATAVSPDADLNTVAKPPRGADAVKPCVTVGPKRAIVILSRTTVKAGD